MNLNLEAFAFFNQQLAGMLNSGIPLEGALQRLAADLGAHPGLRSELLALEGDLKSGTRFEEALERRTLPKLYRRLVVAGARSGRLPAMLILLADYYRRKHTLWTRLRALMVYPFLVLVLSAVVSGLVGFLLDALVRGTWEGFRGAMISNRSQWLIWGPCGLALAALTLAAVMLASSWLRERCSWRLPGLRECRLAGFAGALELILGGGVPLPEALALVEDLEEDRGVAGELRLWRERIAQGAGRMEQFAAGSALIPPLFIWTVSQSAGNLAEGFGRAARLYTERSRFRLELMLYAFLPSAVLALGFLIVIQAMGGLTMLGGLLDALGSLD